MAKQRINALENHLEKGVLGIAAAVLCVTVFLFLIRTPVAIVEGGRKYGPGDYDKDVVRQKAELLKATFNRQPEEPTPIPDMLGAFKRIQDQPLASVGGAREWPSVQPFRPLVPPALGIKPVEPGQILLARVVAPEKPLAFSGLTTVEIEPARSLDAAPPSVTEQENLDAMIREKGRSWVTVAAVLDLDAQKKEFRRAHYGSELHDIYVCRVRAQRQKRLPGGKWSDWQDVQPWLPYLPPEIPEVELSARGDGYVFPKKYRERDQQFLSLAWNYALEIKTPLPPFGIAGEVWRLPPLADINWCTLDLDFLQMEPDDDGCNPYYAELPEPAPFADAGQPGGTLSQAQKDRLGRLQAAEDYKTAAELAEQSRALPDKRRLDALLEVERLIKKIKANPNARKRLKDRADRLLAEILPDIEELEATQAGAESDQDADQAVIPAYAVRKGKTAVWAHDIPVEGNHTYRYRVAVDLHNNYLGNYDKLLDTEAASRVLVEGEWSEPSNPVEVPPDTAFFVSSVTGQEAKLDVFKWFRGKIANRKPRITLGQRVGLRDFVRVPGESGRFAVDFDTGFTLLAVEEARPVLVREAQGRDGKFRFREETTPVILCVDDRGRLLERSKAGNQAEQREWSGRFKKAKAE